MVEVCVHLWTDLLKTLEDMMVTTRDKRRERLDVILDETISRFRETGEPVSSNDLAERCGLSLSPATIRTVMKELEDEGYLSQPHASAGRIPTVKGYRYYVTNRMTVPALSSHEADRIRAMIEQVMRERDVGVFMDHIAHMLSEVTDLVGIAMTPLFDVSIFDRLEIVGLGGSRYLLVISLRNGLVRTINLTLDKIIPRTTIEETGRLLTSRLSGLTIGEIKRTIGSRVSQMRGGDRSLVDVILTRSDSIFTSPEDDTIHVAGLSRLAGHAEFVDSEASHKLVDLSENKLMIGDAVLHSLTGADGVTVDIGGSPLLGESPPLSIVAATCLSGGDPCAIGIIGPTSIHYERIMAILSYTATMTTELFSS